MSRAMTKTSFCRLHRLRSVRGQLDPLAAAVNAYGWLSRLAAVYTAGAADGCLRRLSRLVHYQLSFCDLADYY